MPWVLAVPLLAAQAARQFRFGDALSMPLAVVVAWGVVAGVRARRWKPRPVAATLALAFFVSFLELFFRRWILICGIFFVIWSVAILRLIRVLGKTDVNGSERQ